jgi:tetratricopeptide (TPR) repeat protein
VSEAADTGEGQGVDLENSAACDRFEEKLFLEAKWEALVRHYRERCGSEAMKKDVLATGELHFRRGQILEERIGDPDGAIEAYWTVAQLIPEHAGALRQLRRIHARREDWSVVAELIELEAATSMKPHERAATLAEIGEMKRTALADLEGATTSFEQALAIDENQIDALTGLARTRAAQDREREAAELWQRCVDLQRGPDRAIALVALGELLQGPLDEPDRAADCFRRALTDDPRNTSAVEALVVDAERREQWSLLADLSERRFSLAAGARRRTEIALAAGRIQLERLDSPPTARLWLDRARELSPDDERIVALAADIERRAGNRTALLGALEDRLANAAAPELAALLEAAELCSEADDDERALDHLRDAVLAAPTDPDVMVRLDECLRRLCRDAERVDVLERRVALADSDATRAELLGEIAHLQEEVLEDEEAAQQAWSRCFELDPGHPEAIGELIARLSKSGHWEELRRTLTRACESGPEARRADMLCSLGELQMLRFDDPEAAARAYEAALDLDPQAARALEGLAQIAEGSGDDDAILRTYAREAALTTDRRRLATLVWELVRIHDARGETDAALGWLERLREVVPEDRACLEAIVAQHERRADLEQADAWIEALEALQGVVTGNAVAAVRNKLSALHRRAGDNDAAIRWAEASLETDPRQLETARELVEIYRDERRHEDRARVQRQLVEQLAGDEQTACLVDLSKLLEEQIGDLDGAIVLLWRIATQPGSTDEHREHLAELLERAGRYEELVQHLHEQRRRLADDAPEARALELRRAGLLLEPLAQFEQAASEYRRLRDADPTCTEALTGLERSLRAAHDTAGLARLLAERAASAGDPAQRRRLELERAVLLEEAAADFDEIRAAYAALAEQDEDAAVARRASERLEQLLERAGEWGQLRARLEASLDARRGDDALALRERLATLCRDRLADRAGAIEHFEAAGALAPARAPIWQALALLYAAEDRTDDLRRVIDAELACELEPVREAALRSRAARLCSTRDATSACRHYERVLELEPGHAEATEFLVDHYGATGEHERLVELLEARLAAPLAERSAAAEPGAAHQRTSLRLRIASLQADSLDDLDAAIATLEPALAEQGPVPIVAEPLAELLQRAGRRDPLIELCREVCRGELGAPERARWQLRLADTLRSGGRREEAVATYRGIQHTEPVAAAARAALRALYRELDRPEPLAELLVELLGTPPGADAELGEPFPPQLELAMLYADRLDRPEDALRELRAALTIDPSHGEALSRALALAETHGSDECLEALLGIGLEQQREGRERGRLLQRRGRLLAERLGRPDEAIEDLREAVSIDSEDLGARRALRDVYQCLERWQAALDCLYVEARLSPPAQRLELLEEGAALARVHISADASLPWLERLRAERPEDVGTVARIAELHRQAGRPEALLSTLEQQIDLVRDAEARSALHADRARILERDLGSPGRALAALDAANAAAPGKPDVLRALARLRGELGFVGEQVATLEQLIEALPEAERRELHEQCAALCSDQLDQHERARRHLEAALASVGNEDGRAHAAELLSQLGASLRSDGRTSDWARVAERELALRVVDEERAALLREQLAHAYAEELGAREAAYDHWLALAAWAARDDSNCAPERRDAIERERIDAARALRSPIELERHLTEWLERHRDDTESWLELARLRDEVLHSTSGAGEAYRRALACEPDRLDALLGLRGVAERGGDYVEVADTLDRELELRGAAPDGNPGALMRRLGTVAWHRLSDVTRAEAAFSRALGIDSRDLEALRSLQQMHESCGNHSEAVALYERECEQLGDGEPERRMAAWLRAGELARDYTDEPARALAAYDAAAALGELPVVREREWAELLLVCGEPERHAEVFAAWCDREDSPAVARDHLMLADHLTVQARAAEALERNRAATRCDPESRDAWDALARRCLEADDLEAQAEALERGALLSSGREACGRYVAAALAIETADGARALGWLERAVEADPGDTAAHAHLARVAEREQRFELAEQAAQTALVGAGADSASEPALRIEASLVGGRCARRRGDLDAAAVSFRAALRIDPDHSEALAAAGEALYEAGDAPAARQLLEHRLASTGEAEAPAAHLVIIGEALEIAGRSEEALARFEAAVGLDPELETAHSGRVRCLEFCDRVDEAVDALVSWGNTSTEPKRRADTLMRAALLELERERAEAAVALLEQATGQHPACTPAWCELAELRLASGDESGALEAADGGSQCCEEDHMRARLERVRARVHERAGAPERAAEAWAVVVASDPRDARAVLEHSRLLRTAGDWAGAAEVLASFAARHPDPTVLELAAIHVERGRLLSGPLEDVEAAIAAYERALVLDPSRSEARAKLASLLALVPGRRREAVAAQGVLLRAQPADPAGLRSLMRAASEEGLDAAVSTGASVLHALGVATEEERGLVGGAPRVALAQPPKLPEPGFEALRQAVRELSEAFEALPPQGDGDAPAQSRSSVSRKIAAVQAELAAPRLDELDEAALRSALYGVAALALDPLSPHAETTIASTLDAAVGRRALRRARRHLEPLSLEAVCTLDPVAWRDELRGLAAAVALDRGECELRGALLALVERARPDADPGTDSDLSALVSDSPSARALLVLIVSRWCERIERDIRGER